MLLCAVDAIRYRIFFWVYLLFLVWVAATVTNPADPDLWHRLAFGQYLSETGHFPPGDAFSYLADYQQIADHEWGGGVIFYFLWQWAGGTPIVAIKIITLAITLALIVWAGLGPRRPTIWLAAFYALIILSLLPSFQSTVRCMVFTHIFFALWVYWYQLERRGRSISALLYLPTIILWANIHGGFVIGLAWLFLVTLFEYVLNGSWKKWAFRFCLCSLATLINPYGAQLWISTLRALVAPRRGFGEWEPVVWFGDPVPYLGYKLLFLTVIIGVSIQIYRKGWKKIDQRGVVLLGFFLLLSLDSARHTSLFALMSGVVIPGLFPKNDWMPLHHEHPLRRLAAVALNSAFFIFPLFMALRVLPVSKGIELEFPHVSCPVDAVNYLKEQNVRGNLLVPFNYGSYALWELQGQMRVSMDGRYDLVYKTETYRRVDDFFSAHGDWHRLLTSPAPDAILVPRSADVYYNLRNEPNWRVAWQDPWDAIFLPR